MSTIIFDIEGNNLREKITKVWCIATYNLEENKYVSFMPEEIEDGLAYLSSANNLVGHGIIGFDLPALSKLHSFHPSSNIIDTLILSRLENPDRETPLGCSSGAHSVEAWALRLRLKQLKVEHEDWSIFTPEMLHRCETDVVIQTEIYKHLKGVMGL